MIRSSFCTFLLLSAATLSAEEKITTDTDRLWPETESFEGGIPSYFKASTGKISLSQRTSVDGKSSLRWDYQNESSIEIKTGPLGNTNVYTGYGNYSRSSITLPVNIPETSAGKLVVEFRSGEQVAGHIDIPLSYTGWQKIVLHYSWRSQITWTHSKLRQRLDNIRIRATGITKPSHVLFDAIEYNQPKDFRAARPPITNPWHPKKPTFATYPKPTTQDLEKLKRLETLVTPSPNTNAPAAHWKKHLTGIQERMRKENIVPGSPLTKPLGHYYLFLNHIANQYCGCPDPAMKAGFAKAFAEVNRFLQEQGLVTDGALGKSNNYSGRTYVDAVSKMRQPLADHKQLISTLNYVKWSYHYDNQLFRSNSPEVESDMGVGMVMSMDYLHNDASRMMKIALMHPDERSRWQHLNHFRTVLSNQIIASIKPDGSLYHHGFHYFAYGRMGMNSTSGTLLTFSQAGLPIDRKALDSIKRGLMQMRWYAGSDKILLSICGRHPSAQQKIPVDAFLKLAQSYSPYLNGKWEPELVAAYLRLRPDQTNSPDFKDYHPEASPTGFTSMPFAGLGLHRRDHWLAAVKGFSQYVKAGESYNNANRFGLYLSNGFLEIHSHPKEKPTPIRSGIRPDNGWNWCAIDGTTTIHAPLDRIANGNRTRAERSGSTFNGGLSHNGTQGMFVLNLQSKMQAQAAREKGQKGKPLEAQKSWFFFDNHIVCLGSGISLDNCPYPVRTNLFQKYITAEHQTIIANGTTHKIESSPQSTQRISQDFPNGNCQFLDPYGNGYITKAGSAVKLTAETQNSRDGYDQKDTSGRFATAWIDHGTNPQNATYEYALLPQTTAEKLTEFSRRLHDTDNPDQAPYRIIRHDTQAHIVHHTPTKITAYAIFDPSSPPHKEQQGILKAVTNQCLVMVQQMPDHYLVSATQPDLRPSERGHKALGISFDGVYNAVGENVEATAVTRDKDTQQPITVVTLLITHGESITFRLERQKP